MAVPLGEYLPYPNISTTTGGTTSGSIPYSISPPRVEMDEIIRHITAARVEIEELRMAVKLNNEILFKLLDALRKKL